MVKHEDALAQAIGAHLETGAVRGKGIDPCGPRRILRRGVNRTGKDTAFGIGVVLGVMAVLIVKYHFKKIIRRVGACR